MIEQSEDRQAKRTKEIMEKHAETMMKKLEDIQTQKGDTAAMMATEMKDGLKA
jgi:hypothetical protein